MIARTNNESDHGRSRDPPEGGTDGGGGASYYRISNSKLVSFVWRALIKNNMT